LADPARRNAKLLAQVLGAFVAHHGAHNLAFTRREAVEPRDEVESEHGLFIRRRPSVVAQAFLELILVPLATHAVPVFLAAARRKR
jgi:hypothetical protein